METNARVLFVAGILTAFAGSAQADDSTLHLTVVTAAGDIGPALASYRDLLGGNNNQNAPPAALGRREINWDAIPDEMAAPAFLPGDFFKARGAVLATPGEGVQASAKAGNGAGTVPRFGNIHPSYAETFQPFSADRMFSPVGSNAVDLTFTVPGTGTPAAVTGFGAVYVDVDQAHTAFEYFDAAGNSLGRFAVPVQDGGFSFLGVRFDQPVVARVRIEYGTVALGGPDGPDSDVAVMDDFIFGEPQPLAP